MKKAPKNQLSQRNKRALRGRGEGKVSSNETKTESLSFFVLLSWRLEMIALNIIRKSFYAQKHTLNFQLLLLLFYSVVCLWFFGVVWIVERWDDAQLCNHWNESEKTMISLYNAIEAHHIQRHFEELLRPTHHHHVNHFRISNLKCQIREFLHTCDPFYVHSSTPGNENLKWTKESN